MISPLAADLALAVEMIGSHNSQEDSLGAYGQAFSLLNCGISAGVMLGPAVAGLLFERFGWSSMSWVLACISASAVVPIVSTRKGQKVMISVVTIFLDHIHRNRRKM